MWLILAFVSATFLGFYDTSKKASLKDNAVLPVLLLNTIFSTIIFSPFLLDYLGYFGWFSHISWLDPSTVFIDSQTLTQNACCTDAAGISQKGVIINSLSDSHSILRAHLMVILKAPRNASFTTATPFLSLHNALIRPAHCFHPPA